jgi:hypothetical protein
VLGLAVMAVLACMAFVGASSASATKFCKNNTSTVTCSEPYASETQVHSVLTGTASFEMTTGEVLASCTASTLQLRVENAGGAEATVSGPISSLTWGFTGEGCGQVTETLRPGRLEFHQIANTNNATATASKTQITSHMLGVSCIYEAGTALDIGVLTGGNPAILDVNAVLTKTESGFLCPEDMRWTASYEVTSPTPLYVTAG